MSPADTKRLLKLLDAIGSEHAIQSLLIGGSLASHLKAITTATAPAQPTPSPHATTSRTH